MRGHTSKDVSFLLGICLINDIGKSVEGAHWICSLCSVCRDEQLADIGLNEGDISTGARVESPNKGLTRDLILGRRCTQH